MLFHAQRGSQGDYVQDERYAAGAGMRRSGFYQVCTLLRMSRPSWLFLVACKIDAIAPHIHVLNRDIPFILNITPSALREFIEQWFQIDVHGGRLVLVPVVAIRTVSNRDVAPEPPRDGFMGVSW